LLEEDDAGLAIGVFRLFNNNREGMMRKVVGAIRANGRPYVFGDDGAVFFLSDDGVEWRSAPSVPGTEMDAEAKQLKSFIEDMEAHEADTLAVLKPEGFASVAERVRGRRQRGGIRTTFAVMPVPYHLVANRPLRRLIGRT
jgi:hypothetical protein